MKDIARDIVTHDTKSGQHSLEEIYQRYESLLLDNPDGIFEVDLNGFITRSNPACEHILGYSRTEFLDMSFQDLIALELRSEDDGLVLYHDRVTAGETVFLHKSRRCVHVRYKCIPIVVQGTAVGVHLVITDITEDKKSRKELEIANEGLQTIFDTIDVSLWLTEAPFQTVRQVSPKTEKIWGVPLDVLMTDYSAWFDVIHPDDVTEVTEKMKVIEKGHPFIHDYRIVHPSGEIRWIHDRVVPMMDEHGSMVRVIGIAMDITTLKLAEAERERARSMLERSDRLAVLGQLAAGIAHEIRNPLTSVSGFIQLLRPLLPERSEYFDVVTAELRRIHSIVDEFLAVAKPRQAAEQMQPHSVKEIIESTASFLQAQTTLQNISIVMDCAPTLPAVHCMEGQLKQVFMNLLRNSMEAMPNGGTINIAIQMHSECDIVVRIADHGCGIPPELLSRIGEPFLTTKETGTGLGMMVTRQIIEGHGGRMLLESEVNHGTVVSIVLPVAAVNHPLPTS